MLHFAIIGFGGLGKLHFCNIAELQSRVKDVKLVAICDVDKNAFHVQTRTNLGERHSDLDVLAYRLYTDVEMLLEMEQLDFVITALPTYLHEKIAILAMEKGIHVFSEKPMALSLEQADHMIHTARKNNVKLMIGQCLRYMPEYVALKELIDHKTYGKVIKADFFRYSATPEWSWQNWMKDERKSGGACLDLHVHDVDFIHWAFGLPKSVSSVGTHYKTRYESISTVYHYDGMLVTSNADWAMPAGYPFTKGFSVRFEKATVLMTSEGMKLYSEDGKTSIIDVPNKNCYLEEIVDFICCIRENRESMINPPEASRQSIRLALAETESIDTGYTISL